MGYFIFFSLLMAMLMIGAIPGDLFALTILFGALIAGLCMPGGEGQRDDSWI
ncbi:MAG: hypothetical protein ACYTFG_20575 [Planctomycetota bacterium]|jgi:hypothetical protein